MKPCRCTFAQKHTSQSTWQYWGVTGCDIGDYQKVTSVRSTSKGTTKMPSLLGDRVLHNHVYMIERELNETQLPRNSNRIAKQMWKICNPHPCSMVRRKVTCGSIPEFTVLGTGGWSYRFSGVVGAKLLSAVVPLTPLPDSFTTRHRDLAITKAYSLAKSPDMPIQVYLGELAETLHMLRNPLGAIRKFLTPGRRTNAFRSHTEMLGGSWLEYRYGWMPLVYQVNEIIDAFNSQFGDGFPIHLVRAGSTPSVSKTVLQKDLIAESFLYARSIVYQETSERASAVLATRQKFSADKFWGNRWSDTLQTAWELKTLSFVWDWIFNIGDWLGAIVPDPTLNVIANSVSIKRVVKVKTIPLNGRVFNTGAVFSLPQPENWIASYTEERLDRVVNLQLPSMPIFRQHLLSIARTADALSLLTGKIIGLIGHKR